MVDCHKKVLSSKSIKYCLSVCYNIKGLLCIQLQFCLTEGVPTSNSHFSCAKHRIDTRPAVLFPYPRRSHVLPSLAYEGKIDFFS